MDTKAHWENIYDTKKIEEVSWYQPQAITAIHYIKELNIAKDAVIIDVGGGDSFFVDYLINNGFTNISVLDISRNALERAQDRLGDDAHKVNWIEADASNFASNEKYDFWYDRAAFHFLTDQEDVANYTANLTSKIKENGQVVIGTFSEKGPAKCSGIPIQQYSAQSLENTMGGDFFCTSCQSVRHPTPFDTEQDFVFCTFVKKRDTSSR